MTYNKPRQQVDVFELINTQIKLDDLTNKRLNAVVTVYDPSGDICNPLGKSYLTVFDAFVGLPAPYMGSYIGEFMVGISKTDGSGKTVNQVTATVQSGVGLASEAVVIKADGATIYRNIDFVGQNWDIRIPAEQSSGSGFISWREVLDMNFDLKEDSDLMYKDLK